MATSHRFRGSGVQRSLAGWLRLGSVLRLRSDVSWGSVGLPPMTGAEDQFQGGRWQEA